MNIPEQDKKQFYERVKNYIKQEKERENSLPKLQNKTIKIQPVQCQQDNSFSSSSSSSEYSSDHSSSLPRKKIPQKFERKLENLDILRNFADKKYQASYLKLRNVPKSVENSPENKQKITHKIQQQESEKLLKKTLDLYYYQNRKSLISDIDIHQIAEKHKNIQKMKSEQKLGFTHQIMKKYLVDKNLNFFDQKKKKKNTFFHSKQKSFIQEQNAKTLENHLISSSDSDTEEITSPFSPSLSHRLLFSNNNIKKVSENESDLLQNLNDIKKYNQIFKEKQKLKNIVKNQKKSQQTPSFLNQKSYNISNNNSHNNNVNFLSSEILMGDSYQLLQKPKNIFQKKKMVKSDFKPILQNKNYINGNSDNYFQIQHRKNNSVQKVRNTGDFYEFKGYKSKINRSLVNLSKIQQMDFSIIKDSEQNQSKTERKLNPRERFQIKEKEKENSAIKVKNLIGKQEKQKSMANLHGSQPNSLPKCGRRSMENFSESLLSESDMNIVNMVSSQTYIQQEDIGQKRIKNNQTPKTISPIRKNRKVYTKNIDNDITSQGVKYNNKNNHNTNNNQNQHSVNNSNSNNTYKSPLKRIRESFLNNLYSKQKIEKQKVETQQFLNQQTDLIEKLKKGCKRFVNNNVELDKKINSVLKNTRKKLIDKSDKLTLLKGNLVLEEILRSNN